MVRSVVQSSTFAVGFLRSLITCRDASVPAVFFDCYRLLFRLLIPRDSERAWLMSGGRRKIAKFRRANYWKHKSCRRIKDLQNGSLLGKAPRRA